MLASLFNALGSTSQKTSGFARKIWVAAENNWYLGLTSFGGPPVHFRIFHQRFVEKLKWIDEQMYQELFAVCQALSGPGSTKMYYCINLIHDGFLPACVAFLIWSLPGAIGMYGLSVGISKVNEILPRPVYALLSGLNSATVGIIALAAVQLAQKAITDKLTRVLVFLGATAGMLYNALWYFPLLMFLAGFVTVTWDFRWLHGPANRLLRMVRKDRTTNGLSQENEMHNLPDGPRNNDSILEAGERETEPRTDLSAPAITLRSSGEVREETTGRRKQRSEPPTTETQARTSQTDPDERNEARVIPTDRELNISWQFGTIIIFGFCVSFVVIMLLRGLLKNRPLLFSLFSNLYLAGTIIFGGGPVVIPLLREYVVAQGWVSSRDFLLGLAVIQAFPGPNFNFAVYLGSLTALYGSLPSAAGALVGYIAIFAPGVILVHGTMGIWSTLRTRQWVKSGLRGINAAAVGLIFTAVYRLWEIGYVDENFTAGTSLGRDPWWVVVTATTYVGCHWFGLKVPFAILLGGVMGLVWYGVTLH